MNKGANSRLGWTKYSDLYETVHLSLDFISLCLQLTGAKCGKGLLYIDMYVFQTESSGVGEAILDFIEWFHSTDFGKRYVSYTYSLCRQEGVILLFCIQSPSDYDIQGLCRIWDSNQSKSVLEYAHKLFHRSLSKFPISWKRARPEKRHVDSFPWSWVKGCVSETICLVILF